MSLGLRASARARAFQLARSGGIEDLRVLTSALLTEDYTEREVDSLMSSPDLRRALGAACRISRVSKGLGRCPEQGTETQGSA